MIQRLGIGEFVGLLIDHIEAKTQLPCYDSPDGKASPFYSVEFVKSDPDNTKTMYVDVVEVWIHCISEEVVPYSNAPVFAMVKKLEQAMGENFTLPPPFKLFSTEYNGVQTIKKDESGEGHAVLSFSFRICYGFAVKQL